MACINPSVNGAGHAPKRLEVRVCSLADEEHHDSKRQYAHVFHRPGVICVANAWLKLPETYQLGILLHEIGHILSGPKASEEQATRRAAEAAGVDIEYRDSPYGRDLEWVCPPDLGRARRYLGL